MHTLIEYVHHCILINKFPELMDHLPIPLTTNANIVKIRRFSCNNRKFGDMLRPQRDITGLRLHNSGYLWSPQLKDKTCRIGKQILTVLAWIRIFLARSLLAMKGIIEQGMPCHTPLRGVWQNGEENMDLSLVPLFLIFFLPWEVTSHN